MVIYSFNLYRGMQRYGLIVPKEFNPIRQKFESYLKTTSEQLDRYGIQGEFRPMLLNNVPFAIGSRTDDLAGYLLSYYLEIPEPTGKANAKHLSDSITMAIRNALWNARIKDVDESQTAVTFYLEDKNNRSTVHTCDIFVVYHDGEGLLHFLQRNMFNGGAGFQVRNDSKDLRDKLKAIGESGASEDAVAKEFLRLLNMNTKEDKRALSFYLEAVNSVYDSIRQPLSEDQ